MSVILKYIEEHPDLTPRLIGITYKQFQDLWREADIVHLQKKAEAERLKTTKNVKRAGRKITLPIQEQILLTLLYLYQYPSFLYVGAQFGVCESTANTIFRYWLPILTELLPPSILEKVKKKVGDEEVVKEILTLHELTVDSTEQPIERPTDNEEQKEYFSGKKKNHTLKNQLIVLPKGEDIVDIKIGEKGPVSDIKIFKEQQKKFDPNQKFKGDKAYVGGVQISTPHKKPKNQELSLEQKEENKVLGANRIFVEHLIRRLKNFRIAAERFRLIRSNYESIISTVCVWFGKMTNRSLNFT
ncbi:transposase [Laspinema sp. A4]|uniref:transposase n=1 Tax=Laspinema sp. D2d TaxID=2953686 RepID=UPI0021BAF69F|nr:transposase [Laspinema sp. D2d]MCT7986155.1 transposase [Laspinema sp. D2d]